MSKIKFGKVVLLGRPNTGKSTLINTLMNQKVSITSPLPQTTRRNLQVLYQDEVGKFLLWDTPGVFSKVEDLIGRKVNAEAPKSLGGVDVVVCVVDISRPKNEEDNKVVGIVRNVKAKKVLVYNKIDEAIGRSDHTPEYSYLESEFDSIVRMSALKGTHKKHLLEVIFEYLPEVEEEDVKKFMEENGLGEGPKISIDSYEYVSELIREKAYLNLRREVPYSVNVKVESIEDKANIIVIKAVLFTTADRYKRMIIGAGAKKIRQIGSQARKELELMSARKVFLELRVETDRHWMENIEL